MQTRRHHFVPRFLLAGFTNDDGVLFVHDLHRRRRPWPVKPEGAAHERDFYRVNVPGEPPSLAEDALSRIESEAAPLIRRVIDEQTLPSGVERETLLWFVALLAVRVPKQRAETSRFATDLMRLKLEAILSSPERYASHIERLRKAGKDVSGLSREELQEALRDPAITMVMDQTWSVGQMFEAVKTLAPAVVARQWSVLAARPEAPNFICSDHPVSLLPRRPTLGLRPLGWAMPDTFAFVPLSKRVGLYGLLDVTVPERLPATAMVAEMNTATLATADKYVYSPGEDFIWTRADRTPGHASDVVANGE